MQLLLRINPQINCSRPIDWSSPESYSRGVVIIDSPTSRLCKLRQASIVAECGGKEQTERLMRSHRLRLAFSFIVTQILDGFVRWRWVLDGVA